MPVFWSTNILHGHGVEIRNVKMEIVDAGDVETGLDCESDDGGSKDFLGSCTTKTFGKFLSTQFWAF